MTSDAHAYAVTEAVMASVGARNTKSNIGAEYVCACVSRRGPKLAARYSMVYSFVSSLGMLSDTTETTPPLPLRRQVTADLLLRCVYLNHYGYDCQFSWYMVIWNSVSCDWSPVVCDRFLGHGDLNHPSYD